MAAPNNNILRRIYEEVMTKGKFDLLNELIAADCVDRNPMPGQRPGRDGIREALQQWRTALPDLVVTVESIVAEGDRVCGAFSATGTHKGTLMGIPATNRPVTGSGMDFVTVRDGKIVDWRHNEDLFGLLTQLGVIDPAQLFGGQFASGGQPRPNEARAQPRR